MKNVETAAVEISGRHDPCIVPRAVPVVEAAAAIAIFDMILGNTQTERRKYMEIQQLRTEIDAIDRELVALFTKRMEISAQVADYKKAHDLPIYVPAREREILRGVAERSGAEFGSYTRTLYSMIFELSRSYQTTRNSDLSPLYNQIQTAIDSTPKLFPQEAMVACQGVEGAYSQIACEKMFKNPFVLYFKNFEGVFNAIDQGLCQYGILPIENSTAGSVNKVYDLMLRHNFSIVRSLSLIHI